MDTSTAPRESAAIPGLDAFRFLAFLLVYLSHCGLVSGGYIGVQAFFVLSGFLITPILLRMRGELGRRQYFTHFYGRRVLRIFPLYYAYLLLVFFVLAQLEDVLSGGKAPAPIIRGQLPFAATYTFDFFEATQLFGWSPLMAHLWSLSIEEQFYLLYPLVLLLTPRGRLPLVLGVAVIAGPLARALTAYAADHSWVPILSVHTDLVVYLLPFSYIDAFAWGGLAACQPVPHAKRQLLVALPAIVVLGFATSYVSGTDLSLATLGYPAFMNGAGKRIWGYSVLNYVFALTLVCVANRQLCAWFFANPVATYLGRISYGLYIYHLPAVYLIPLLIGAPMLSVRGIAVTAVTTVAVSVLSYEIYEKRFLRLKDVFFPRSSARLRLECVAEPSCPEAST